MGYGKFIQYLKAASMLRAQHGLASIQYSSFHAFKKESREKITRALKAASTEFLKKDVKDYRDVLKNLAMGLMKRG